MSEPYNDQVEDLVNRAVLATRQLPLPAGPSPDTASQTLAALRDAVSRPRIIFLQRIRHMPWTSKTSAVLAMAASMMIVYLGLSNMTGSALAFADVVNVLNKVRSATWKTRMEVEGPENQTVTWTSLGLFLAPSHERTETTTQGAKTIQIADGEKDMIISLVPATKTAVVIAVKNLPSESQNPFGKTFLGLRQLAVMAQHSKSGKVERLGAETIDGRPTQGFRIEIGSMEVKIWADPKTLLPIRVEETTTAGPKVHIVMTDFQVDVDLDESLFSVEVPEGYTVQQTPQLDLSKKPISYLADALKMAAELNDGVFPPTLRGEEGIDGIVRRPAQKFAEKHRNDSPKEIMKLSTEMAMKLGGAFGVLLALSPDNDWHYAGKDVKLDTPNRPIFWYKADKTSDTYQVLYADLSIKEVSSDEVPKLPKTDSKK